MNELLEDDRSGATSIVLTNSKITDMGSLPRLAGDNSFDGLEFLATGGE